jgi:hypothetical protein
MRRHDVILIADQFERERITAQRGEKIDENSEAQALGTLPKPLGRDLGLIALVSEHDEPGLNAYGKAGFEIIAMNGNRPAEVSKLIAEMQSLLSTSPPSHLILMTTDPKFAPLCQSALANPNTELRVWAPAADVPPELAEPEYNFRQLEELLPDSKVPNVVACFDYENLHIGLLQRGYIPDPAALVTTIRSKLADLGNIANIFAYADWDLLSQGSGRNLQRELTVLGVRTRYQVNIKGKNTADMEMADDIRTLLDKDNRASDSPDIIVLGTRDRDFRRTLDNAKARGKRIILLTLHNGLSNELRAVAEKDVRYLDDMLGLPKDCTQVSSKMAPTDNAVVDLILKTELWLRRQGQEWACTDALLAAVAPGPEGASLLQKAVAAGAFAHSQRSVDGAESVDMITLAAEHKTVQAVRHIIAWLPDRITYALQRKPKPLPWVGTKYLADGMQMDVICQRLNIGQSQEDAHRWLDRLAAAGLVIRRRMPHPDTPTNMITTWWLPRV